MRVVVFLRFYQWWAAFENSWTMDVDSIWELEQVPQSPDKVHQTLPFPQPTLESKKGGLFKNMSYLFLKWNHFTYHLQEKLVVTPDFLMQVTDLLSHYHHKDLWFLVAYVFRLIKLIYVDGQTLGVPVDGLVQAAESVSVIPDLFVILSHNS